MMETELGDVFDSIYSVTDSGILDFRMLLDGKWIGLELRIEVVLSDVPLDAKIM
jgi:hypothetical protein